MRGEIILFVTLCLMSFAFGDEENAGNFEEKVESPLSKKYEFLLRPKRGLFDLG